MARTILENIVIQHYENASSFEFCQYTSIRFFEILYFKEGSGTIKINGVTTQYSSDSTFVFVPDDVYIVSAEKNTTVTTIKFLKSFLNSPNNISSINLTNNWFRKIEGILHKESHQARTLEFQSKADKKHLPSLIELLHKENEKKQTYDSIIIENTLTVILHLIARNIKFNLSSQLNIPKSSKIQDIINYLHTNIYDPELLTNKHLAMEFNVAENYIGQYFKKYMEISLKKYILNYKLRIVETRLKYTDMQVSEIALELGFTDSSHLNKIFQAYKGTSIASYRNSVLV